MADSLCSQNAALAADAVALLKCKALKLATAESCTAGLLSAAITAISGASTVFDCGVAAYAAEIKHGLLGVPDATLKEHGTVSSQTATAMANGVRQLANADIGISITGVAGPDPSEGKPVGTVYIALTDSERVWLRQLQPSTAPQSRDEIREAAVHTALTMLLEYASAYPAMNAGSLPLTPTTHTEVVIPENPTVNEKRFLATILPWRGDTIKERIIKVSVILIAAVLLVGAALFINRLIRESSNRSLYTSLQNLYSSEQEDPADDSDILPRFSSLRLQNADIGGWVRIDGTSISYPVMKNAGSDYYADHNFYQQDSEYGVPYFDSRNSFISPDDTNKALVIYGNNTRDGQMFSALTDYRNADFFKQHNVIDMSTLYTSNKWVLFSVMVLDPEEINAFAYAKTTFESDQAFLEHVADMRKRSLVNTDVEVAADDRLVVLVTQADEEFQFDNALLVVVGRRLRESESTSVAENATVSVNSTVLMPRIWVRMHQTVGTTRRTTKTTTTTVPTTTTTPSVSTTIATKSTTTSTTDTDITTTTVATTTAVEQPQSE